MSMRREVLLIFAGVAGALTLATCVAFILRLRLYETRAKPVIDNLIARVRAWWVMVIVLGTALIPGRGAVILLFAIISMAALREFITLTPTRRADHGSLLLSFFVVTPIQYWLIWMNWYGLFAVFIPVYAFLVAPIASLTSPDTTNFLARTSEAHWGAMICIYCISYIPALLTLDMPGYQTSGPLLVIFVLLVTQSSDVLQFVWGKLCGRHRIAPEISPSKTVEGFLGGAASATALGGLLWRITPFNAWQATAMALTIVVTGFLGGLVMSAIKRDLRVKDWGWLIEGHGGILDRLDSVAFAAPIFFHLTRYFVYLSQ